MHTCVTGYELKSGVFVAGYEFSVGVFVSFVEPGSQAEKQGLKVGISTLLVLCLVFRSSVGFC